MNALKKLLAPPWPALGLGVPSLFLMVLLMRTGIDDRKLFIPGHFAGILLLVLSAAMLFVAFLSVKPYSGKARYGKMFPPSTSAALGILGAAAAVLYSAWQTFAPANGLLEWVVVILGLSAGIFMVYLAWCRFRGLQNSFLLWTIVTVYLMLHLMLSYRNWSAQPELLRYCFPLFASVCITLAVYHRTAFCVGMGNRRIYLFFSQMGAFFSLVTLGAGFDLFTLGMLLWCLLDVTSLQPTKAISREEQP